MNTVTKVALFFTILFTHMSYAQTVSIQNLHELSWTYRVLLLNGDALPAETLTTLADASAEINARQVVWFWFKNDKIKTNFYGSLSESTKQQMNEQLKTHNVILIGKDGESKLNSDDFNWQALLHIIDNMPMRRQEMQN